MTDNIKKMSIFVAKICQEMRQLPEGLTGDALRAPHMAVCREGVGSTEI